MKTECPFHLVCDAIFQGPTCQLLAGSLKELARRLHVSELAFAKLDCKIKWETEHPKEMLNHVLLNWKSVQSKDATLIVLINELEHLQLNDAAGKKVAYYGIRLYDKCAHLKTLKFSRRKSADYVLRGLYQSWKRGCYYN